MAKVLTAVSRFSRRSKSDESRSSLPASIFEKSRMSFRTFIRDAAQDLAMVSSSRCSGWRSPVSASSTIPRMPFIGVRISWLIFARNSLLARLAGFRFLFGHAQLLGGAFCRRDVAAQAYEADDLARCIAERHLGCENPLRGARDGVDAGLLAVDQRFSRPEDSAFVGVVFRGQFPWEDIEVGLSQQPGRR